MLTLSTTIHPTIQPSNIDGPAAHHCASLRVGTLPVLSPQELVDCIPNPNSCGGTGGCSGSTEEYGFAWAMIYGMATDSSYNYTARTGKTCLLGK